jgi:hypothetical protein
MIKCPNCGARARSLGEQHVGFKYPEIEEVFKCSRKCQETYGPGGEGSEWRAYTFTKDGTEVL